MASSVHSKAVLPLVTGASRKDQAAFDAHRRLYSIPMRLRLKARYDQGVRMGNKKAAG